MTDSTTSSCLDSSIELLRCSMCKKYLTSPIYSFSNENGICGKCSNEVDVNGMARQFTFEAFLRKFIFPCAFKTKGCEETLQVDKLNNHEVLCAYQQGICPISSKKPCLWKGLALKMHDHLKSTHAELITNTNAKFKIYFDQTCEEYLLVAFQDAVFIIKYFYNCSTKILNYEITYVCNQINTKAFYKIDLYNESDTDYKILFKKSECSLHNDLKFDVLSDKINLWQCETVLGNPKGIFVLINFNVELCNESVDYDLLNSIRCCICSEYLVPPLFSHSNKFCCNNCSKKDTKFVTAENTSIDYLINKANYPCRWLKCKFIGKSTNIKIHEQSCAFQLYKCLFETCSEYYILDGATDHYDKCHKGISEKLDSTFIISFKRNTGHYFQYIYQNKTLFLIRYFTFNLKFYYIVWLQGENKIKAFLDFQHDHCKLKSKPFKLNIDSVECEISEIDLPKCYLEYGSNVMVTIYFNK